MYCSKCSLKKTIANKDKENIVGFNFYHDQCIKLKNIFLPGWYNFFILINVHFDVIKFILQHFSN